MPPLFKLYVFRKMKRTRLIKAQKNHIPLLVKISIKSFDSDIEVGADEKGGPPEYDSIEWHEKMAEQGHLFTAVEGNNIIGGAILFSDDPKFIYVGRIFIDPQFFRKGYGIEIMEQIEEINPDATTFNLDTPIWNKRTNNFYKKIGYIETKRDNEFVYYQKIINR